MRIKGRLYGTKSVQPPVLYIYIMACRPVLVSTLQKADQIGDNDCNDKPDKEADNNFRKRVSHAFLERVFPDFPETGIAVISGFRFVI